MAGVTVKLADGTPMPSPAFGTGTAWSNRLGSGNDTMTVRNEELVSSIKSALRVGYRHLNAAEMYGTEYEVGKAITESGVPCDEIFLTTKVWPNIGDPAKALAEFLKRLQVDYVDL